MRGVLWIDDLYASTHSTGVSVPLEQVVLGVLGRRLNKPQGTLFLRGLQIPALSFSLDLQDDTFIDPFLPKLHLCMVFYHSNRNPQTSYYSVHTARTPPGVTLCRLGTVLTLPQWSCFGLSGFFP